MHNQRYSGDRWRRWKQGNGQSMDLNDSLALLCREWLRGNMGLMESSICSCVDILQSFLIPYLLTVVGIYGVAQLIPTPTSNAPSVESSPGEIRGWYLAVFQYSFFIANIIGPGLFTFLFTAQFALPWLVMAGIATISSLMMYRIEPHLPRLSVRSKAAMSSPTMDSMFEKV